MKKLIVVFVVLALAGTALFAQTADGISVGGWGRTVFSPLKATIPDEGDAVIGSDTPVNMVEARIVGKAEKIGFETFVRWDGTATATWGDNAYIWVQPVSFLKIGAGRFNGPFDEGLRGKIGTGSSNGLLNGAGINTLVKGEDAIFQRFKSDRGGVFLLQPVEGLVIGAVFNTDASDFDESYKHFQVGAGYTIGNIGVIRAQFLAGSNDGTLGGSSTTTPDPIQIAGKDSNGQDVTITYQPPAVPTKTDLSFGTSNRIQAAFALTAVEGLTVDIGGTIPLGYTEADDDYQDAIGVDVGAKFAAGDFSILGRVDVFLGKSYTNASDEKYEYGLDLYGFVEPAYKIGTVTIAADVAVQFTGEDTSTITASPAKEGGLKLGAGAWLGFPLGNGDLKLGVMAQLPTDYDGGKEDLVVSLPISLQYSF
jgi:hypothetical protein